MIKIDIQMPKDCSHCQFAYKTQDDIECELLDYKSVGSYDERRDSECPLLSDSEVT